MRLQLLARQPGGVLATLLIYNLRASRTSLLFVHYQLEEAETAVEPAGVMRGRMRRKMRKNENLKFARNLTKLDENLKISQQNYNELS